MTQELLHTTKEAISALSNPSQTQRANSWLTDFEKQSSCWEIAMLLLMEPPQSVYRFYGAKILYSKIQRDFHQLDSGNMDSEILRLFRETATGSHSLSISLSLFIVKHMNDLSRENPLDMKVCRYMSLCLSALALQLNHNSIIKETLIWLNPSVQSSPRVILQLLIVLPEECFNRQVDVSETQRDSFLQQLTNSCVEVLNFLQYIWISGDLDTKLQIIHCLENWIRYTNISSQFVVGNTLFFETLAVMFSNEIFVDPCIDMATAMLQRYRTDDVSLMDRMFEMTFAMISKWSNKMSTINRSDIDEDDIHSCQSMTRYFAEVAEVYLDVFLSFEERYHLFQQTLIQQLLECASFSFDLNISRIPLKFFYELSSSLRVLQSKGSPEFFNHRERYLVVYSNLLSTCISQITMPMDILAGTKKVTDDVSERRYEWKDTVSDCCIVIGALDCFKYLHERLFQEYHPSNLNGSNWNTVEAILFSIQLVSANLPDIDHQMIASIVASVLEFPPNILELKFTVLNLLASLSRWISCSPELFGKTINLMLLPSLKNPQTSVTAARAINEILVASNGRIAFSVSELLVLIDELRKSDSLTLSADLYLIEAAAVTMSGSSSENTFDNFWKLIDPIFSQLQSFVQSKLASLQASTTDSDSKSTKTFLGSHLEKLTVAFRYTRIQGSFVLEAFNRLFPILDSILQLNHSDHICEKLCRFLKHAIRSCGVALTPHVEVIGKYVLTQFQQTFASGFIYVASILVSDFSKSNDEYQTSVLYGIIWTISSTVLTKLSTVEQLINYPDVVEEYYYLLSKVMRFCPKTFMISSNEMSMIFSFSSNALTISHREAQKGVLSFYENFIQVSTTSQNDYERNEYRKIVEQYGDFIVQNMFLLLSATYVAYSIDERDGCISDVLWALRQLHSDNFPGWIQASMSRLPPEILVEANKLDMLNMLSHSNEKSKFVRVLDDFEFKCNRKR